jgi:hypothetical protein
LGAYIYIYRERERESESDALFLYNRVATATLFCNVVTVHPSLTR